MGIFSIFKPRQQKKLEKKGPASQKRKPGKGRSSSGSRTTWRSLVAAMVLLVWGAHAFTYLQRNEVTVDLVVGQSAPRNVIAEVDFQYVDANQTNLQRLQAAQQAPYIFRFDRSVNEQVRQNFQDFFNFLNVWDPDSAEQPPANQRIYLTFGANNLRRFKELLNDESRQEFFMNQLREVQQKRIVPEEAKANYQQRMIQIINELDQAQPADLANLHTPSSAARALVDEMAETFVPGELDGEARGFLAESVVKELIKPNTQFDLERTNRLQQLARDSIPEVKKTYRARETIILNGERITQEDLDVLKEHARAVSAQFKSEDYWMRTAALMMLCLVLTCAWAIMMHVSQPEVTSRSANVVLLGVTVALNLLLVWGLHQSLLAILHVLHGSLMLVYVGLPLAFASVLLSILLRPSSGMLAGFLLALLLAVNSGDSLSTALHVVLMGTVCSVVGALSVKSARTRIQTFRTMAYLPVSIIVVELMYMMMVEAPLDWVLIVSMVSLVTANVLLITVLVNLLLPFFEVFFSITTNVTLLELSDLNHPLLKRLQLEAPGTFHHTMNVATLAEHAAEAIGANTLLCRVASYFHDVGKLSNPGYFTENNIDQKNQHDDLNPHMSARIIVNHVKEGLELAKQYKLRAPIRDAIATHHGTSLVFFFYHRAKQEGAEGTRVEEAPFRYPGPLPRTRESTIISIADSCEAASRSLSKPTPQKIDAMVNDIVRNRMLDGQLDESEMTMDELNRVVATIKKTLHTMRHARIAYPKDDVDSSSDDMAKTRKMTAKTDTDKTRVVSDTAQTAKKDGKKKSDSKKLKPEPADSAPGEKTVADDVTGEPAKAAAKDEAEAAPEAVAAANRTGMKTTVIASREALEALAAAKSGIPVTKPTVNAEDVAAPEPEKPSGAPDNAADSDAKSTENAENQTDATKKSDEISAPPADSQPPAEQAPAVAASAGANGHPLNGSTDVTFSNDQEDVPVKDEDALIRLLRRGIELSGWHPETSGSGKSEVSFALVDLKTIEDVNVRHLEHEGPTDVITFDYSQDLSPAAPDSEEPSTLGEIMVCPAIAVKQAAEHEQDIPTEMVLYLVHGILHLSGHDDQQDADRQAMREAERDLLGKLRNEFDFAQLFGEPAGEAPA